MTLLLNGAPATAEDLRALVATNYGHFTAMRVEGGRVRGLGPHLERLAHGTRELFGSELDPARVRAWLREALAGDARALAVRINVYSRSFDRAHPLAQAAPDVLISIAAATPAPDKPLCLKSFRYARELPQIKHVGTFPLFHFRGRAQRAGADDALFVGDDGRVSEASVWNVGFHDGTRIVWPQAPQLDGVGMRLLQAGLARLLIPTVTQPVRLDDLQRFRAAFVTNANTVARLVASIDEHSFARDDELLAMLRRCHESNPAEII